MTAVAAQTPVAAQITEAAVNGIVQNGDAKQNGEMQSRFATGLILPPPDIKSIIDRTATFVARSANSLIFEDKVREGQRNDPKFSFLNPADPYHGYYRHKMARIQQGEEDEATVVEAKTEVKQEEKEEVNVGIEPLEPPPPDYILERPQHITAIDLDVIKLTALFTARRGRAFLHALAMKEARNYEFEFLRPTHSLFGYFNALVEQFSKVLLPSKETVEKLKHATEEGAKWRMLEISKQHAEWERLRREREKKNQDDKEAERTAFAEIDWHDYAIVQTIEFTTADANSELPPPVSLEEMISRTLAQKKMAAMIMEDAVDEVEAVRARQAAAEAEAANVPPVGETDATMEVSDDEDAEEKERKKKEEEEMERARALQATSMDASGPMKIRMDYVPKLSAKGGKPTLTTCSICGQQIPVDELQEHMRIELLDPRWKSQRDALEARRAQLTELQKGANVESSLKLLARARVDIFGTEADEKRRLEEKQAEEERRKQREKVVWDGHTASKDRTLDKFQTNVNFDEQIEAIYRAKGLSAEVPAGPGIGPAVGPGVNAPSLPPPPPSLPAPPRAASATATPPTSGPPPVVSAGVSASAVSNPAFAAATVSAGPQPSTMFSQPAPVMLPPLHYQGLDAPQPFGYTPPPPSSQQVPASAAVTASSAGAGAAASGMHPSRVAALAGTPPVSVPPGPGPLGVGVPPGGMVRTAEQMGGGQDDGIPPAKKQKVIRTQFYPEHTWIDLHPHPISIQIQLPEDKVKPEWKLDGSIVILQEVAVTALVSTLRESLVRQIESSVPLSRIMLSLGGKMLSNASTLANYNIEDEDMLVLSVRDPKRRK